MAVKQGFLPTMTAALALGAFSLAPGLAAAQSTMPDGSAQYSYKRPSPTTITTFSSLVDLCNTPPGSGAYDENHGVCVGYFSGFVDLYLAETPISSRVICLPNPPITRQQARDTFMSWQATHPEYAAQPASVGVYHFLASAYPCSAAPAPTVAPPAPLAQPR